MIVLVIHIRLLLRSLKTIIKDATIVAMIFRRSTPGIGTPVELSGGDASGLLNFISIGKTLSSQRIASEEAPPTFLQVQPAGSFRNEDVMEPRMLSHPGTSLSTSVAGKVVSDDEDVAGRIIGFDVGKQGNVVG